VTSRFFADVTPLRESVRFRRLYVGQLLAVLGREFTVVAVPYQVYLITESTLLVGALGVVQFIPLMISSVFGGAVVDAFDRRKLLVLAQLFLAATAVGLAANAGMAEPAVWPLFVLSGLNAAMSAVDSPARKAAIPAVLHRDLLPSGFALIQTMTELGHAIGPAVAGFLIAQAGLTITYGLEAVTFVAAALTMYGIGPLIPEGGGRKMGMASVREGLRFLKGHRLIQSLFVIDLNAMVFGMPRALFPAMGTSVFGGDASTVGLLYAAPGVGSLIGALTSGWVGSVRRRGRVVVWAVLAWGLAITAFGLVSYLPLALVLLAAAGGADVVSAVFRNTIQQLSVPDALRGRLSGIQTAVTAGGPRLGDFESGLVASAVSIRFSVVSGGVASALGALVVARFFPELWSYPDDQRGAGDSVAEPPSPDGLS
jgi:MFS family permease